MEFMLLPAHRGVPRPKTPFVCGDERYDGGPFMSYPERMGRSITAWNGTSFDFLEYHRANRVGPPEDIEKFESFIQNWLYFGLLAEFLGINESVKGDGTGSPEQLAKLYSSILVHDNGRINVAMELATLDLCLEIFRSRMSPDPEIRKARYEHLILCLTSAHPFLTLVAEGCNYAIRSSIAALCELLAYTLNFGLQRLGIQGGIGRAWSAFHFFTDEVKISMKEHGWCPSDIARAETKYSSMQTVFIIGMLDRSLPGRDHSGCTEFACNLYQINLGTYNVSHQHNGCTCKQLDVDSNDLTTILEKKDIVPLLRFSGNLNNLHVELIESGSNTSYVAISHVWADGLGNPYSNSLHRCRLHRLVEHVKAMSPQGQEVDHSSQIPLIWLDTLCCPAIENARHGKQLSIEKLQFVYRQATHVLVLDAGLMAYDAEPQDVSEKVVRIFTSSWMRRLWTLQEGALAKSLYFQFADISVGLEDLGGQLMRLQGSMRHRCMREDIFSEFLGLNNFFAPDQHRNLWSLDKALKYRSVSVPTDEPLCIGTLMSLDLPKILAVEKKEDRMQKVWELLVAKYHGMPYQIIFFQEEKLSAPGWRWAPKSFLLMTKGIYDVNNRLLRWSNPNIGTVDHRGLRVQYPGWRISATLTYPDNNPRNPFPGFPRIPEEAISFRCTSTGRWFRIQTKELAYMNRSWTDDERHAYNARNLFPLHEFVDAKNSVLVAHEKIQVTEAVFGEVVMEGMDGICVKSCLQVLIQHLHVDSGYIYDIVRQIAMDLRSHEVTEKHLIAYERLCNKEFQISPDLLSSEQKSRLEEHKDLKGSMDALRIEMKAKMRSTISEDERLASAIKSFWGDGFSQDLWVLIYDFFWHDYEGERIGEGEVWYID